MTRDEVYKIDVYLGVSGLSLYTQPGLPASTFGRNGESYIDEDTGYFYVKDTSLSDPWVFKFALAVVP